MSFTAMSALLARWLATWASAGAWKESDCDVRRSAIGLFAKLIWTTVRNGAIEIGLREAVSRFLNPAENSAHQSVSVNFYYAWRNCEIF